MTDEPTCEERIEASYLGRMEDLRAMYKAYQDGEDEDDALELELPHLHEYGLCFDLVEAGTFQGQADAYYRYQISWGGPSDEFCFYQNGLIEYCYKDWFDGATKELTGEDAALLRNIFKTLKGTDMGHAQWEIAE